MQSIKADTDQIFATINKHEKDIKDANSLSKKERSILDLQEDASTLRVVRYVQSLQSVLIKIFQKNPK